MQITADSTTAAHRADADEGGVRGLVYNALKDVGYMKRCAIVFCIVASGVGWAAIVGLVLLLQSAS
jgi:hypothetical protein